MTQQNSSKRQAERLKQAKNREFRPGSAIISDEPLRQQVATAYQRALDAGFTGLAAAREAAIKTGETVASVLSIWKSVKAR